MFYFLIFNFVIILLIKRRTYDALTVNVGIVLVDLGRRRRPGIATLRKVQDRFTHADISSNLKGRGVSLSLQHFILGRRSSQLSQYGMKICTVPIGLHDM